MVLDPWTNKISVVRQRCLQEPPAEWPRCAPATERPLRSPWAAPAGRAKLARAWQIVTGANEAVGTLRNRVAILPYDSRERLRSKEHDLALLGISWTTDAAHDAALARELEVARQRRRVVGDVASGVAAEARPRRAG